MNELYKVKYYQLAMLKRQGYITDEEDKLSYFENFEQKGMFEEFVAANHVLNRRYISRYSGKNKYCYYVRSKVAKKDVDEMKEKVGTTKIIFLIFKDNITPVALQGLIDLTSKGYRFITFKFAELSFDLFRNDLVPLHVKLSKKKVRELISKSGISLDDIPRVMDQDPPIKRIDALPGDVIKICRKNRLHNSTVRETVAYRLVVYQPPEERANLAKKIII